MYTKYEKIRNSLGLNDSDVANATGIAKSTLSDWKRGLSHPKADKLLLIANLLKVPVETLINRD